METEFLNNCQTDIDMAVPKYHRDFEVQILSRWYGYTRPIYLTQGTFKRTFTIVNKKKNKENIKWVLIESSTMLIDPNKHCFSSRV